MFAILKFVCAMLALLFIVVPVVSWFHVYDSLSTENAWLKTEKQRLELENEVLLRTLARAGISPPRTPKGPPGVR